MPRVAVCAALDRIVDVGLVRGPAGFGKTSAVAEWVRTSPGPGTAWVRVDAEDEDPGRLWSAVLAALARCPTIPPSSRLRDRHGWPAAGGPEFLAALAAALDVLPRPPRLVLDDVGELTGAASLHGLRTFLRDRRPDLVVVLCGRGEPPLGLARLRVARRVREIGPDLLRFTPGEAEELLRAAAPSLGPAEVTVLHARTAGWPAALGLAAAACSDLADPRAALGFSGEHPLVADYLEGEALAELDEAELDVLRRVGVVNPVPTALAAVLSGRADAGGVLDAVEQRTGLVRAEGLGREVHQVEPLLRDHLFGELRRQAAGAPARLEAATARWYAAAGRPDVAAEHAARSGDALVAAEILRDAGPALLLSGRHRPLRRALDTVGEVALAREPGLAALAALARTAAGGPPATHPPRWPEDPPPELAVLRAAAEEFGAVPTGPHRRDPEDLPHQPGPRALGLLARALGAVRVGAPGAARPLLVEALELADRHAFVHLAVQTLALRAVAAALEGDAAEVRHTGEAALARAERTGLRHSAWAAAAAAVLAHAALLRVEPGDAVRLAEAGLGGLDQQGHAPAELRFGLAVIRAAADVDGAGEARGDRARGLDRLQHARAELGDVPVDPHVVAVAAVLEHRAALDLGHPTAARSVHGWLVQRVGETAESALLRAWTDLAAGRDDRARAAVHRALVECGTPLLGVTEVEAWLVEATLAAQAGQRAAAREALEHALALAEPLGALRPFAGAGAEVRRLLVQLHGGPGAAGSFAGAALAVSATTGSPAAALSERERAVLALLPSLLSLEEIGADLSVSVNTVKTHVRSIYGKLGVSSRRTAVLAGYERGLIASGAALAPRN
ncbi:LuxR C-terminal-related transcriptional regulator [Pseudonocardia sp. RS11V-5]|uniref:LuxR C-terminal-related transcriptional regulator n=1 Tax=Pseudonocardia terrae TaxID=2905831 RepID=UPI001E344846|nr:LuxR C-terminal-related transcriptional regulator [Pseudonocardia terrae]MCE3550609.1 LuxR C-terminal-related transcriptional regulator [Pseudonocardia terrae]